jgi:hypothetical protein
MAKARGSRDVFEIRLKTVEQKLDEIFGRVGLLDEQARQVGYRSYLAAVQLSQVTRQPIPSNAPDSGEAGSEHQVVLEIGRPHRPRRLASRKTTH